MKHHRQTELATSVSVTKIDHKPQLHKWKAILSIQFDYIVSSDKLLYQFSDGGTS